MVNGHSFILIRQMAALATCALAELCTIHVLLVIGSIARSAKCRYLSYSDAVLRFFAPRGDKLHRWG